ncbi:MMPL family transporter [Trujillonella endophytica]|uniref:Putative drug exporter of the RND superfamily n=1 Tax=Trujillonella endophytica TaxID=673521 RepID=A0A1H8RW08_9ACTN|nr:MMPL family transporter [Trujillella endophytica]SEO70496.1 putative drug exporter of the RND superfamily [Trujillella endophytica]
MAVLLSRLGAFSARRRLPVLLVWLAVLAGGGVGAVTLGGETAGSFAIPGQESTTALERIDEEFGGVAGATARVVFQAEEGQNLLPHVAAIQAVAGELARLPGVVSAADPFDPANPGVNSAEPTIAYVTVTYDAAPGEVPPGQQDALADAVEDARGSSGLTVEVGGEAVQAPPHIGGPAEVIGVVVALLVLAVTFGSLLLAGMNLLSAVIGVGIGVLGVTIATGFTELSSTTPILAAMLGLAVGIDYALFIITRYRQELRRGSDVDTAIATAVGTAGSAVVTAGLTVVIALAGLSVVGIPFLTQMGVAAAATIVVAVLVALTLVPAVLGYLGARALPRKLRAAAGTGPAPASSGGRGWLARWVAAVTRRRVLSLLLTVVALGVVSIPFASMQTTLVQDPPEGSSAARAQTLLAGGFGEGFNGPLVVLFEGEGAADAARRAVSTVSGTDDVARAVAGNVNTDGTAATLNVIPESGPSDPATERLVADLRAAFADLDGIEVSVTGATAVSVDVAQALDDALPVYLLLVVGLALVLLVLVFRSLLVPLVGVLGFLLTVGASLGATVAVFQWGWLAGAVNLDATGPLISLAPILVIGILFGLAMDYQIFLVSRMHEAHSSGVEPLAAIRTGFRQAAPVVVAAALIMFSVFAGFVPAGEETIKMIAFALAMGIVFDAFVVRMVLVPAALALLGERAWWLPRWLGWLPRVDVEGAALERAVPVAAEPVGAGTR